MTEYTLALSDAELGRYRFMAEVAQAQEGERWRAAGIAPGAVIADVGCGPAAISAVLAGLVGPTGRVIGVERDPVALSHARQLLDQAGATNVELREGTADDTGVEPGSVDVVMMRHVLAHNGGSEQAIVNHLATLVRPGGTVYLVDVDLSAFRMYPPIEAIADVTDRYVEFHSGRGNDPLVGLRLGRLLAEAGLVDVVHAGNIVVNPVPLGLRPPAWAAREAMLADGVVDQSVIDRWAAGFEQADAMVDRPTMFVPQYIATGRRSP